MALARELSLLVGGVLAVSASSWVSFAFGPVPITLQTFTVLLLAALYGAARGAATLVAWLALGALGAPLFADGARGLDTLLGATGGYLLAFLPATVGIGWAEREDRLNGFSPAFAAFILASLSILAIGATWLSAFIGVGEAWRHGVQPFLLGGVLKAALAAICLAPARRVAQRWQLGQR